MAKILAVANQKGGVGKTTTAVNLVHYAADVRGQRVLVVDFDPQANTTSCFVERRGRYDLTASTLFNAEPVTSAPTVVSERIHIIPSDEALKDVEAMPIEVIDLPFAQLRRLDYDLIIIDTPPTLGIRLIAALKAADSVLTPFIMDKFSLDGIGDLMETIQDVRARRNPNLKHLGILPSKFNSRSASQRDALIELREAFGDRVLPHVVTERTSVSDALAIGVPVWAAKRGGESGRLAAVELMNACADIYERVMK